MPSVTTSRRVSRRPTGVGADLPSDFLPVVQPCSSAIRDAIARAATRLGCSRHERTGVEQRRWDARRLPGARRRRDDGGARRGDRANDRGDVGVDGKRNQRVGTDAETPTGQLTPVPPSPQYPPGFFARYCW